MAFNILWSQAKMKKKIVKYRYNGFYVYKVDDAVSFRGSLVSISCALVLSLILTCALFRHAIFFSIYISKWPRSSTTWNNIIHYWICWRTASYTRKRQNKGDLILIFVICRDPFCGCRHQRLGKRKLVEPSTNLQLSSLEFRNEENVVIYTKY